MRGVSWRWTAVMLVAAWFLLFSRLGDISLMDDEAHYARLTSDMAVHEGWERWLVPRLGTEPFIDKPPLFHWVQAVTTAGVTQPETGARLPSALAAAVLLIFVAWVGSVVMGVGGWQVSALLLTVPATILLGRSGYLDMLFSAALFGAVGLLTLSATREGGRWEWGAGALLAVAMLTKGPVAVVLVAGWAALAFVAGPESRSAVRSIRWGRVALVATLVGVPWFAWMFWRYGLLFAREYFGTGHAWYFTPRASASSRDASFYLQMFLSAFFPWSLIAVGYGVDSLRALRSGVRLPVWEQWMWLWIVVVLMAFTLVPFRVDRYIYPAAPACCLLALRGWRYGEARGEWRRWAGTIAGGIATAVLCLVAAWLLWRSLPDLNLPLPDSARLVPVLLGLGGLALGGALVIRRAALPPVGTFSITVLALSYALIVAFASPALRAAMPVQSMGDVARSDGSVSPVGLLGLDRYEMGLRYYLASPPILLRDGREAQRFLAAPEPRVLITTKEWRDVLAIPECRDVETYTMPAIIGTRGRRVRSQVWTDVVILKVRESEGASAACSMVAAQ